MCGIAAGQATATLTAAKDTAIFSNGSTSSGGGPLVTGRTARFGERRTLVRFELGSIPQGSTIVAAALGMTVEQSNSGPAATSLHPLLQDWGEGTTISPGGAGAPANPGDATWADAFLGTTAWQTPGGDFGSATSSLTVGGPGRYQWTSSASMVQQVQAWLDQPQTNHGWAVITDESLVSARLWNSREHALASDRPTLTVDYIPPASVSSFGTGCVIRPFQPSLQANGPPRLGDAAFALRLSNVPNGLGLLFFAPQFGLGSFQGCTVFLAGTPELAAVEWIATPTWFALPVPNQPSLGGLEISAQALAVTNQGISSTSNGLRLTLGL